MGNVRLGLDCVEHTAIQEIWYDATARFDINEDGIIRIWLVTTENHPDGDVHIVVAKLRTTLTNFIRGRDLVDAVRAAHAQGTVLPDAAPLH